MSSAVRPKKAASQVGKLLASFDSREAGSGGSLIYPSEKSNRIRIMMDRQVSEIGAAAALISENYFVLRGPKPFLP